MTVGIVGLGYVGLPLAVAFAETGRDVVGVELAGERLDALREGRSYVEDMPSARLAAAAGRLRTTADPQELAACDAIVVCVPTPLNANREPDLGPLEDAGRMLAGVVRAGQLVVLESTTFPGTTRERLLPLLEASRLRAGHEIHLAYSPERVDPGRTDHTLRSTPKLVGGLTAACAERAVALYEAVCDHVVRVSTPEAAELAKLLENVFRSVNIALVNELAILAERMGIDVWEVIDAAATKPYGFMGFEPGPGMGGHCLPVDPFYLAWRAREFDMSTEFIELAGKINRQMPRHCVHRIERALNRDAKAVNGARVVLLGVSYKPGVGDVRESPAVTIVELLRELGADVTYSDPFVAELPALALRHQALGDALDGTDLAVIVTAHAGVDYERVVREAPRVLDLRGVTRGSASATVERL